MMMIMIINEWANQPDSSIGTTDYHCYCDDDYNDLDHNDYRDYDDINDYEVLMMVNI